MGAYILRRLVMVVPVLLGVTLLVFSIAKLTPGDPVHLMLGFTATPEQVALLRSELHLDDPIIVQYGRFLWGILHGDLGVSFRTQFPVLGEILVRLPNTLELTVAATVVAAVMGITIGVIAAQNKGGFVDGLVMVVALGGLSIPTFWLAILLILLFGVRLHWISPVGGQGVRDLILPVFCLSVWPTAVLARLTRANVLEIMNEDYVRTARAKGLLERWVMFRHVLRNAWIPLVTYLGLLFADLLGGAVFIENVFARPGIGRYIVGAIINRDFPQVQGTVVFTATGYVLLNLLVDLLYGVIDPRISLTSN
jgi:peptide/nickel transport system permease protein